MRGACDAEHEATEAMITTGATTKARLVAFLSYILAEHDRGYELMEERGNVADALATGAVMKHLHGASRARFANTAAWFTAGRFACGGWCRGIA